MSGTPSTQAGALDALEGYAAGHGQAPSSSADEGAARQKPKAAIAQSSSLRMRLLRFPLVLCVVLVHSSDTTVALAKGHLGVQQLGFFSALLKNLLSEGLARSSVPVSLLMAGYLLAMSMQDSFAGYAEKLRSKSRTLLLPFLFWNLLTLALYAAAQALPASAALMSGRSAAVAAFGIGDFFAAILGLGREPIAYQFWFIRDLLILTVLSPLLLGLLRIAAAPFLLTLFTLWMTSQWPITMPTCRATLFFCVGLQLGRKGADLFQLDPYARPIVATYLVMLLASALPASAPWQPYLHWLTVAMGVPAFLCWSAAALKFASLKSRLLRWSGASFFVFAAHEPLLTVARKLAYLVAAPATPALAMALYFFVPLAVVCALEWLHAELMKKLPVFTSWVTGGRK